MTARPPESQTQYPYTRWNFVIIALDVSFFITGLSFLDPVAVLPVLIQKLNGSEVMVGAMGAIQRAGWIVPQLIGASFVLHRTRKKPFIVIPCLISRTPFIGLALAFWFVPLGSHLQALLFLLIGVYALFFFADGLCGVPWHDIIARTIPPNLRGRFFGTANIVGGLFAVGAGAIVRRVLADPSLPFPHNYARLFVLLCVCMAMSMLFIMLIKEPPGKALEEPQSFLRIVRAIPGTLRRYPLLRRVIIAQNLLGFGALAIPFYAVYGHSRLGLPESMGGVFIWASVAGSTSASVMWAYLNDRKGPLTVLRGIAAAALLPPIAAITIPLLLPRFAPAANIDYAYCSVFFLNGIAMSGGWMGLTNYVFELAPDEIRPLFLGLASTLSAPVILMPMIGGLLLSFIAYHTLFAIALAGGVIGIFYVYTLERPHAPAPDAAADAAPNAAAGPGSAFPPSPTGRPTLD